MRVTSEGRGHSGRVLAGGVAEYYAPSSDSQAERKWKMQEFYKRRDMSGALGGVGDLIEAWRASLTCAHPPVCSSANYERDSPVDDHKKTGRQD